MTRQPLDAQPYRRIEVWVEGVGHFEFPRTANFVATFEPTTASTREIQIEFAAERGDDGGIYSFTEEPRD